MISQVIVDWFKNHCPSIHSSIVEAYLNEIYQDGYNNGLLEGKQYITITDIPTIEELCQEAQNGAV